MKIQLMRYRDLLRNHELVRALRDPQAFPTEAVGVEADLEAVVCEINRCYVEVPDPSRWDSFLVAPLHRALRHLPRRTALDMRLWHWLCVAQFSEFVWRRWRPEGPPVPLPEVIEPQYAERFLGRPSLHGVSRNTLARLWWAGESLWSADDGYRLAEEVLGKQDLFQAIFERRFGLYPPAARACIRRYRDAAQAKWRDGTRKLNHYLTTIVVESLTEEDIYALLP